MTDTGIVTAAKTHLLLRFCKSQRWSVIKGSPWFDGLTNMIVSASSISINGQKTFNFTLRLLLTLGKVKR